MKKRLRLIVGVVSILIMLVGYMFYVQSIQGGQDTVISIYQNDENGTPINSPSPIQLVRKAGHRNPFRPEISGYVLVSNNPLRELLPRNNQTVRLSYRSSLTTNELRDRLHDANYWQVGTQNVRTPIFNATQEQDGGQQVGRISTSRDGTYWTKLPISYPNVTLKKPTFIYQNNRLTLFDRNRIYDTTDFHKWHTRQLEFKSNQFTGGQLQTVINTPDARAFVVIRATDRKTQKHQLYYGKWYETQHKIGTLHHLKTGTLNLKSNLTLNRVGAHFYLLQRQGNDVQILKSNQLESSFKKVAKIRLTVNKKHTVNSINLIATKHGQMRLFFNVVDQKKVQLGTYYQEFSSDLKPISQPRKLSADFLWTSFELAENKR